MSEQEDYDDFGDLLEKSVDHMRSNGHGYRCPKCDTEIKSSNYEVSVDRLRIAEITCHNCGEHREVRTPWGKILDGDKDQIVGEWNTSGPADDEVFERCENCDIHIKESNHATREEGRKAHISCHECDYEDIVYTSFGRMYLYDCDNCGETVDAAENTWGVWKTEDGMSHCPECFIEAVEEGGKESESRIGRVWLEHRDELDDYEELFHLTTTLSKDG